MMVPGWRHLFIPASVATSSEPAAELFTRRNPVRWVASVGALLIAGITICTGVMVMNFRDKALDASSQDLANTVSLFTRHFDQQFDQLHKIRRGVTAYMARNGSVTANSFRDFGYSHDTHLMLKSQRGDGETGDLALFDEAGDLINFSESWPAPEINISHRNYFRALKSGQLPDQDIIQAVTRETTGQQIILFARRVTGSNGEFLGVITRYVEPLDLERFLASTLQGRDLSLRMYHSDGTLLASYPSAMPASLTSAHRLAPILTTKKLQALANIDYGDGVQHIGAARGLTDYPVTLIASVSIDNVLQNWREQTRFLLVICLLSIIIVAALIYLIIREIADQHAASQRELTLEKQRLDMAINNMSQGLLLFDAEGRMVVCNKSYMTMYRLPPDIIKPGIHFREIVRQRQLAGSFAGDIDAYCTRIMNTLKNQKAGEQNCTVMETADGRFIQVLDGALPGGGWVATHEDITERRRSEERIAHLAHYDALTDLPNRTLFHTRLDEEVAQIASGRNCAVIYIDIDEFKGINDTLGHTIGDGLLMQLASRLRACVRETDVVARLGGDEFAIVLTDIKKRTEVVRTINRIYESIREPIECQGHRLVSDASIGVALSPIDGTCRDDLLKNADLAMYAAKADGRRTYRFFKPEMNQRVQARRMIEHDLRAAVDSGSFEKSGFEIYYQPLVSLSDNSITGCEALLRWNHPVRGSISPAEFIPVAEEIGVISKLGEWTLGVACAEAATWPDHVKLAVNVSPVQFRTQSLALKVLSAISATGIAPERLELEITEAVLIRDDDAALSILHRLRELGIRIALDDFGTGYSSLSYLRRFPFDKIKIDRSFIEGMTDADSSTPIVRSVIQIAAARKMTTTAEGVETKEQRSLLRSLGCTQMQGFLFSAAQQTDDIRKLLHRHSANTSSMHAVSRFREAM